MAQLGVQYPSLEGLMGGVGGYATGQRMDIARQNEGINQQQALQDIFQKQQEFPIRQRQATLNADTTEAQLPGVQADSWTKQRNQQVRQGVPLETEQKAQLTKIAKEMTEDDYKTTEAALSAAMVSGDVRAREMASHMLPYFKEVQAERIKNQDRAQRDADAEALKQRGANELMQMQIDAGKFKKTGNGANATIQDRILSGKMSYEQASTFFQNAAIMAELEGENDKAEAYRTQAQAYAQKVAEKAQAGSMVPKAGGVDIKSLGGNIQTNPERQPALFPSVNQQSQQSTPASNVPPTLIDVQKMYPGVPPEKLKEAFKKKFGVDLK